MILLSASMIALGTAVGGWKLIRTLGGKFYKIRPVDGFASQFASAVSHPERFACSAARSAPPRWSARPLWAVGAAERVNKVRWGVAGEIATAWLLTIPATVLAGAGCYWLLISSYR